MNRQQLDALFEAYSIAADGAYVYVCDIKNDFSRWSKAAVDYFGLPGEYMDNAGGIWLEHIHPEDQEDFKTNIEDLFAGRDKSHNIQYRAKTKDGKYVLCSCSGVVLPDDDGGPLVFCGIIKNHDCLNYTDSITNLRSLYGFMDDIKGVLWNKQKFSVIMIGLESFSRANDVYNYAFGNKILRKFGAILQQAFKGTGCTYRMDGTKFAVISEKAPIEELDAIYRDVQNLVAQNFYVASDRIALSLCAGAVTINDFTVSADTVYSSLKYAFAESKNAHHGELFLVKDTSSNGQKDMLKRLNTIRNSIIDGCNGFYICYQPVVNAENEELKGAEALIRWKSEDYGMVPPIHFIPILEQDSLFPELGSWILRQSLLDSKKILEKHPDFIINVNLSYAQLEKSNFAEDVINLLKELNFPARNLCLEVTERCRLLDTNLLKQVLGTLRNEGIRIALDDFGTGFSSLGVLRELPVDTVKIDRGYVLNIETDDKDRNTVRFITDLAKSFSAEVCVEGIESANMRTELQPFKVHSLQGFYYSKPVEIDDFLKKYC